MSASAVYILDVKGKVMISRNYRGDIDMSSIDKFMTLVMEKEEDSIVSPIIQHGDVAFMYIKYNNLYLVATSKKNANVTLVFSFLHKLVQIFYTRFDVSRPLPHKRYTTKAGPAYVMNLTLRGAFRQFRAEYPDTKIGYTLFCQLRPRNVRRLGSVGPETCLCMYCLNVRDLLEEFQGNLDRPTKGVSFRRHLFTAFWQCHRCRELKNTLQEDEVLMVMDFAENRKASFNAEVKSAHFGKKQITLHPIVLYFRSPEGCLVRHSLMYLSDDITHDYHLVHHFTLAALAYATQHNANLKKAYLFSDGCAAQYKGRGSFADLSLLSGLAVQRVYFGSEHGKGEADGETGVLSQMLARAVQGGQVNVTNARDLFEWARQAMGKETSTLVRKFFLVDPEDVRRQRPETAISTVPGTRQFHQIFVEYFKELEEESIRDNFVIIYELLDEVMDFGYPQTTDSKILQEYITQEGQKLEIAPRPPPAVTNAVSWRTEGVKYRKNEVFLDVIESVNLLVSANGNVLRSEIVGSVKMRVFLSGMPELRLGLNDKVLFESTGRGKSKSVELEDVKFHQCVRLSRFENDRTISFIPPDGEFELMSYRLNTHVKPLIWVESVIERHVHSRVEYMIKAKSQFKRRSTANNVEIIIPVPNDADSPKFKTTVGNCKYVPEINCVIWTIKSFPGGKEYLMRAHFGLPSVQNEELEGKPPINVKFEIPYFTVSGIQVRYLKIIEKSGYQALPWVRYITQNGDYQLRTN